MASRALLLSTLQCPCMSNQQNIAELEDIAKLVDCYCSDVILGSLGNWLQFNTHPESSFAETTLFYKMVTNALPHWIVFNRFVGTKYVHNRMLDFETSVGLKSYFSTMHIKLPSFPFTLLAFRNKEDKQMFCLSAPLGNTIKYTGTGPKELANSIFETSPFYKA